MTDRDPFDAGREQAEARRRELEALREDVRAIVREEVGRAGVSEGELTRMVREVVRTEVGTGGGRKEASQTPIWVVAGLVVGLLGGVLGYRALADDPDDTLSPADGGAEVAELTAPGTSAPQSEPVTVAATPTERAARWDSLVTARSSTLDPLLARLEAAAPAAPVQQALEAWRGGSALSDAAARRLHDALVQLTLNELAGTGLALDGLITRGPCRGNSCGALLRIWQERGDALGMPPYPADAAEDAETLRIAERTLLLGQVEAGGG